MLWVFKHSSFSVLQYFHQHFNAVSLKTTGKWQTSRDTSFPALDRGGGLAPTHPQGVPNTGCPQENGKGIQFFLSAGLL